MGNKTAKSLGQKERGGIDAMTMVRHNSQVRQFYGFTPGQRVFEGHAANADLDVGQSEF